MRLAAGGVPPRHRPAAVLVVLMALVVGDWLWLAGPRCTSLGDARARLAVRQAELAAARHEVASRIDTKRAVRETARALRRAAQRLPDGREVATFLADVARSARDARLELLLLRPKAEHGEQDHVEVPVELQVRGTYLDALGFLRRLQRLERLVHIGDLRFEHPERAGDRIVLRIACTAVTYRVAGAQERAAAQHAPAGGHDG